MREITELKYDDIVIVGGRRHTFASVSAYMSTWANMTPEDVAHRVEESIKRGHKLVWLNAMASVLSATPQCSTCNTPTEYPVKECGQCVGRVKHVKDGEVVIIGSQFTAERGYWRVQAPGWMDGDNYQLVRPDVVYEVWDHGNKDSFRKLLREEIGEAVEFMTRDNPRCHIHIVGHNPDEYIPE